MRNKFLIPGVVVAIIAMATAAIALRPKAPGSATQTEQQRRVAATIFPLYDITRQVAGDAVQVELILPANAEPHTYEPKPSDITRLNGASVVFAIGHGVDDWSLPIASAAKSSVTVVDHNVSLIVNDDEVKHADEAAAHEQEAEEEHQHGPVDPHYWLTVPNAKIIAQNVTDELTKLWPDNAGAFEANRVAFTAQLDVVDEEIRAKLDALENRNIVTFHGAWYYFSREYGLNIVGTFEPAPGQEPTPRHLQDLQAIIERNNVKTIFVEPQFASAAYRSFAEYDGLALVEIDDIGGSPNNDSYINTLRHNVNAIVTGK